MCKRFLLIISLVGIIIFLVFNNYFCFSNEKSGKKNCEGIFVVLNPDVLAIGKLEEKIKTVLPKAIVKNIKGTYIVKIELQDYDANSFDKTLYDLSLDLRREIIKPSMFLEEIQVIQQKSPFFNLRQDIIIDRDMVGKIDIYVKIKAEDKRAENSIRYLLFNKSNIYKFLWDSSGFLNSPFFDTQEAYENYLKTVESNFKFIEKKKGIFKIEIISQDKRFSEKATSFFKKEIEELLRNLKEKDVLSYNTLWDNEYETIFTGTPVWKKKHKVIVKEIKGELKKKLEETRISCSFANIYLRDFIEFLRQESPISVHIRHKPNFTGKKLDINIPNELATIGGNLKFMGSHVFSIKAENVKLGTLLEEVLKQLGYRYEIGISGGLEVLFIEPIYR